MAPFRIIAIIAAATAGAVCFLSGCAVQKTAAKEIEMTERERADAHFRSGDYKAALAIYEPMMPTAGSGAQSDTALIMALATCLDSTGRASHATLLMAEYDQIFLNAQNPDSAVRRLAIFYNSNNDGRLEHVYQRIKDNELKVKCFKNYYSLSQGHLDESDIERECEKVLALDANNETALRHLATRKFNNAESQYKKAMAEYNANKNATTYAYLRRDLKRISKVYVGAKELLERLRATGQSSANDLRRLAATYLRLDQPEKAKKIEKEIKN